MDTARCVWTIFILFLAAASIAHQDAQAQRDTSVVMDVPTPEQGEIRVHFGRPVGIRPVPSVPSLPAASSSEPQTRRSQSPFAYPTSDSSPYWLESTARGPALIYLSDNPALPPDTLFLTDADLNGDLGSIDAPALSGLSIPEALQRANIAAPEREAIERMLLDRGVFRALTVQFEFDRSKLLDTAEPTLDALVEIMRRYPQMLIEIGGHTDDVGAESYNRQLSQTRAEAVRQDMIRRGVDPTRLTAVGYGEERPLLPNQNQTHRALNRRVEFRVISQR